MTSRISQYCKIYETDKHGQLLVKIDRNEAGIPEVRFYAQPEGLGVCSLAVSFTDDDEGWDLAEAAFAKADEAFCIKHTEPIFKMAEDNHD